MRVVIQIPVAWQVSCLPSIQTQLLIVFTGKTLGQKVQELAKPFIAKKLNLMASKSGVKAVVLAGVHLAEAVEKQAELAIEAGAGAVGLVPETVVETDLVRER